MAETNITEIGIKVKYETEGLEQASSQTESFVDAAEEATGTLEELGDAAEEAEEKVEGLTAIEIESARATLDNSSKVRLLVDKLRILSKQYASVSKQEGDHSRQLNSIAMQYLNTQKSIDKLAFSAEGGNPAIPFTNMSDEGLKAATKVELLQEKLKQLSDEMRSASSSTEDNSKKLVSLALQYNNTAAQIQKLQEAAVEKADEPAPAFQNMSAEMVTSASKAELLKMKLDELKRQLDDCATSSENQTQKMINLGMQYNSTKTQLESIRMSQENVGKETEKTTSKFGKFFGQLKRIAVYRLIRTALKEITQGFREGVENLYQWSRLNDTTFAASMDNLATSTLYVKNVLGTALAPVIQDIVVPAIYAISEAIADAVNWMNQLIAILKGESTYTRAIRKQTEFAKATGGAAKELKRMLLGFDEINRLEDNSGGGGGSALDYDGMFEKANVDETLAGVIDNFKLTVKDVLFDWSDLNPEQICQKAITGLSVLAGGVAGFMIGGVPGAIVGSLSGLVFSLITNSLVFDHDGVLDENEVLSMAVGALGGLAGGVIGFAVGGPAGALIGGSIGAGITLLVSGLITKNSKVLDKHVVCGLVTGVLGALAGGVIGFVAGGPVGAFVGAMVGAGITLSVSNLLWKKGMGSQDKSAVFQMLNPILGGLIGGILGSVLGPAGALFGFTIGVALTLLVQSVNWSGAVEKINQSAINNFGQGTTVNLNDHGNSGSAVIPKSSTSLAQAAVNKYQTDGMKKTATVTTRANGGYVDTGSLFIAGEAGAEFVGNINGRTGVMNTDQFGDVMRPTTEAIYAIGNAIVSAVSANKDVYIDGKNVTGIVRTNNTRINRAYGV